MEWRQTKDGVWVLTGRTPYGPLSVMGRDQSSLLHLYLQIWLEHWDEWHQQNCECMNETEEDTSP